MSIHNATGAVSTLCRIGRYIFSRTTMVFYEYHYNNPSPWSCPRNGFVFRPLAMPSDHDSLSEILAIQEGTEHVFRPIDVEEAARRLEEGEACYIGEDAGRIVGYSWFAKGEKAHSRSNRPSASGRQDLYLYNSLKGLPPPQHSRRYVDAARKDLVPRGFTREITATMKWNKAAGGSLLKAKFQVAGTVTAGYFLTFRYMINGCGNIAFRNETGMFGLYRKIFRRLGFPSVRQVSSCPDRPDDGVPGRGAGMSEKPLAPRRELLT